MRRFASSCLLLIFALSACVHSATAGRGPSACPQGASGVPPQGQRWYHGPIVEVDSAVADDQMYAASDRRVLVQVAPPGANSGRIWFGVGPQTHLACLTGEPARYSDLVPGTLVSASTRLILESDPGQAFADTLLVGSGF